MRELVESPSATPQGEAQPEEEYAQKDREEKTPFHQPRPPISRASFAPAEGGAPSLPHLPIIPDEGLPKQPLVRRANLPIADKPPRH